MSEFDISRTEDQRVLPSSIIQQQKQLRRTDVTASQEKLTPLTPRRVLTRQIEIYRQGKLLTNVQASGFLAGAPQLTLGKSLKSAGPNHSDDVIFPKLVTNTILKSFTNVLSLSCGFDHCLVISKDGKVFTWGYGSSGVLGHGDYESHLKPKQVMGQLETQFITSAECGSYHNAVVSKSGELFTWGRADGG